jgi:hypothetical protein
MVLVEADVEPAIVDVIVNEGVIRAKSLRALPPVPATEK